MKHIEIIETPIGNFKIATKNNKIYTAKFTKKEITDNKKNQPFFVEKLKNIFINRINLRVFLTHRIISLVQTFKN